MFKPMGLALRVVTTAALIVALAVSTAGPAQASVAEMEGAGDVPSTSGEQPVQPSLGSAEAILEAEPPTPAVPKTADAGTDRSEATYGSDVALLGPCNYSGSHPLLQLTNPYTQGAPVVHLQCLLRNVHGFSIVVDGVFGPDTDNAVRAFQWLSGQVVDGKVGPLTWNALHP